MEMSSIEKNWQIMPKITNEFIEKYPDLNKHVLQVLFNRGLTESCDIDLFLNSDYEKDTHDPFLFNDMEEIVELIIKHVKEQNKIVIYGDYDADGVTSSAVLHDTLTTLKARADVYIPDRVSEGYGLNKGAIDELIKDDIKLIVTVDGGIRSKEEVEYAKEKGVEVVITDHHVPPSEIPPAPFNKGGDISGLPDCLIINALVENEKYPFKYLSGVGIAFKLAKAIISKAKLSDKQKQRLEDRILDLVAIGTVADCVSLLGENRVLVKKGLEILNNTNRIGLQELIKVGQINNGKKLEAWNIGFQIAPRLNAAGRMEHANTALELLITKDKKEAETIARRLNSRNQERQQTTEKIVNQIELSLAPDPSPTPSSRERGAKLPPTTFNKGAKIIIAVTPKDEVWNEGVVGLVAGRISDKYYLPTLVITRGEEGYKGSGRSIEEFNIMEALEECSSLLEKYGGHPMACGFSLKEENLEEFKNKMIKIANNKFKDVNLRPKIEIEEEINLDEVSEELIGDIEQFAPFGQDNDRPKFVSRETEIVDIITMGISGQHIKLRIKSEKLGVISAIGFGQAEKWKELRIGDKIDIVYYLEMNEFNGRSDAQMNIVDIKSRNA